MFKRQKFFILILTIVLLLTACAQAQKQADNNMNLDKNYQFQIVRPPAVAGQFYPADKSELKQMIASFLAKPVKDKTLGQIKAIMVPHAGYVYSGPVAAYAYKQLEGQKADTVFLLCNAHAAYFTGIAIDNSDAWQTPLGQVEVDKEKAKALVEASNLIQFSRPAHAHDHTLEVQLPFLQTVLKDKFKIVPILFGHYSKDAYQELAQILAKILDKNDLVIASTDMSHYPPYEDANKIDTQTLAVIASGTVAELDKHIADVLASGVSGEETALCGVDGVKTVMQLASIKGWSQIKILHYANSGDVAVGDKHRVVGYGAVAFAQKGKEKEFAFSEDEALNKQQQAQLLKIARTTVESYIKNGKIPDFKITDKRLNQRQGAFVTLHKNGRLRGCIGQIIPTDKPLWQVVRDMAIAAATQDTRFAPVTEDELPHLEYEISVLSRPRPIKDWREIELGKHGVIVRKGLHSGVFLPQVADETGWSKEEFLAQLCAQKAGLPPHCYKEPGIELQVFTAQVFK